MLRLAGHDVDLSSPTSVLLDGRAVTVVGAARAVLERLAREPGRVVSHVDLLTVLPSHGTAGRHAAEAAVSRLRTALGDPRIVQTVVKRGYRLAVD